MRAAKLRIEPVARRTALFYRDDLDRLTVLQRRIERHHGTVDTRATAAMPEFAMQVVSKIHRRRSMRQRNHASLRREHVDMVVIERGLTQLLPRLGSALLAVFAFRYVVFPGEQLTQPRDLFIVFLVGAELATVATRARFLVTPMRRHAILGELMHLLGTDLHFERTAVVADHDRM
jgi:hypothetical protein